VPRPGGRPRGATVTDWAEIYRTTYPDLVRYLHRKVWDEDRACELAQEAFTRAIDGDRTPDDPANPRAWVFRIAANLALDEARLVIRRRRHLTLLRAEPVRTEEPDPVERLDREMRAAAARAALERLSDRDREALLLWDAGMSYVEIAEQTGLAVGAVGTTLARARKRLVDAHAELETKHAAH
jgi:RNA polymerase sigma-70 factor, ECF subfamily